MFYNQKNFNKENYFKIFFFILILLICFYRSPYIFINGRFVAEEGSFFFRNSFIEGPLYGLTQYYISSSYFNIWANISSVLAAMVPINYAPIVTVYMAFLIKLLLLCYILFIPSVFFNNNFQRYFISLLVIFSPPMVVAEIWLNTLVSQIYLSLIVFFIIFENSKNIFLNSLSILLLIIACLSSIIACIFTLGFFAKYYFDRNKKNLYQLLSIFFASFVQFIIFIYSSLTYKIYHAAEERYLVSFNKLLSLFYNLIIKTFIGRDLTQFFYFSYVKENNYFYIILCLIFLILFIFFIIKNYKKIINDKIFIFIFIFFILQSLITFFGSKTHEVSGRYISVPGFLLILLVFRLYVITNQFYKKFFIIFLILPLLTGIYSFKENNKYPEFFSCFDCPVWKEEISKWRQNKYYNIKIWQYHRKTMYLY